MEFTLLYKNEGGKIIAENYDKELDRFNKKPIDSINGANDYCKKLVNWFNDTCRPDERKRKFYSCIEGHWARDINFSSDPENKLGEIIASKIKPKKQ